MKLSKWAFALSIAAAFWPGAAVFAQIGSGVVTQNPSSGKPVTYNYGDYYSSQPGTEPAPAIEQAVEYEAEEEEEEEAPQPWRIVKGNNRWGITYKGYTAASYVWNPAKPADKFNGPVTWTDRANEPNLNEFYSIMERSTSTEDSVFDFGGRFDLLFGTSSRMDTSSGFEDKWNKAYRFYGLAAPSAYAEIAYNKAKLKIGRFISPVGFYTVGTANNFFNTIPYTYQYGEPFTHTGALLSVQVNDQLVLGGGPTLGWDNSTLQFNDHIGMVGMATYTRAEQGDSLAFVPVWSLEPSQIAVPAGAKPAFTPRYFQTMVYSRPLKNINENLTYIFQTDFGMQSNATFIGGKTARWYGVNQYLYLKRSDTMSWGANFEWFRDEEGFRVGGFLPNFATLPTRTQGLSPARSGYNGNFFQCTVGPRWTPNLNTIIRPNLRFDWYDGGQVNNGYNSLSGAFGPPAALKPFNNGLSNSQVILGCDFVFMF